MVNKLDLARSGESTEGFTDDPADLVEGRCLARRDNEGHHSFAPFRISSAGDGDLCHGIEAHDDRFDILGIDLLASGHDDVAGSTAHLEEPGTAEPAEITSGQPACHGVWPDDERGRTIPVGAQQRR